MAINILAMLDTLNFNERLFRKYFINNSIVANSNSVRVLGTCELVNANWKRVGAQVRYGLNDSR